MRGLIFWIPAIVVSLAYLTQHNLLYAAGETIDYDQVSDLVSEAGSSSVVRQISFLSISAIGAVLLWKRSRSWQTPNLWLLAGCFVVCGLMMASCVWADDSFQSFKRSFVTFLVLIAAVGIAKHWQGRDLLLFVAGVTGSYLLLGIGAEIAQGSFTLSSTHRLAGTQHPNTQGVNCALLALSSLALFADSRRNRGIAMPLVWLSIASIGIVCLLLTRSRSATVAFGVALVVFMFQGASRNKKVLFGCALLQLAAIGGVLWCASDAQEGFLSAVKMGREQDAAEITTLTGRIPIWGAVLGEVSERPLFGYGYGGFWTSRRVEEFSSLFNWTFMHSHSAYLETLLNVGIVGLMVGLAVVIGGTVAASNAFRRTRDEAFHFITALLVLALVHGFLDSSFARDGIETFIGALAIAMVAFHGAPVVASSLQQPSDAQHRNRLANTAIS